jgi:two-component system response regulator QseB
LNLPGFYDRRTAHRLAFPAAPLPTTHVHIVLIEDDPQLGEAIRTALEHQAYAVTWLRSGKEAQFALQDGTADLVLLDLGLPDVDGLDVLASARRAAIHTPVLVMTARDAVEFRVRGLDLGADDYLVKPFHLDELSARIRSLTRRARGLSDSVIEAGGIRLNLATQAVDFRGTSIELARREFALLRVLMERAGRIVRREDLETALYGIDAGVDSNALEVQVHWLRKKLSADAIRTVRGVGYMVPRDAK